METSGDTARGPLADPGMRKSATDIEEPPRFAATIVPVALEAAARPGTVLLIDDSTVVPPAPHAKAAAANSAQPARRATAAAAQAGGGIPVAIGMPAHRRNTASQGAVARAGVARTAHVHAEWTGERGTDTSREFPGMRGRDPDRVGTIQIPATKLGEPAGDIELFHFSWGDRSGTPVCFIQGMSTHGWWWALDAELATALVAEGFHVISIDNRDVGKSHKFSECPAPKGWTMFRTKFGGKRGNRSGYSLDDMANDYIQFFNTLGYEKVHLIGHSMGAMIAQILAIKHPERVLSMINLSTSCDVLGTKGCPAPKVSDMAKIGMRTPPPIKYTTEELYEPWWDKCNHSYKLTLYADPHFPTDHLHAKHAFRKRLQRDTERNDHKCEGVARQLHAVVACTNRRAGLGRLAIPVLILHGSADPVVPLQNGQSTHAAIPGAKLIVVEHMKHLLPRKHFPTVVNAMIQHRALVAQKALAGKALAVGNHVVIAGSDV